MADFTPGSKHMIAQYATQAFQLLKACASRTPLGKAVSRVPLALIIAMVGAKSRAASASDVAATPIPPQQPRLTGKGTVEEVPGACTTFGSARRAGPYTHAADQIVTRPDAPLVHNVRRGTKADAFAAVRQVGAIAQVEDGTATPAQLPRPRHHC